MISRVALFTLIATLSQAEEPLLAIPGKLVLDAKLDSAPAAPWRAAKGKWEPVEGVLKGSELAADKHGAVLRAANEIGDCIYQVEIKFDGARATSLSINAKKDHMARISMTPKLITIQRDDNDHDGPDKAAIFHRVPADLSPGTWHTVRLEMVGDTMLGKVDNVMGWGTSELFKTPHCAPGVTVGGESVQFRNFKIWEATKNPKWDEIKGTIQNTVTPVATPKGKGKGKGKAKQ
jgi:hypothetical protein